MSKPLQAPFRDGSTVLVRDLVCSLPPDVPLRYWGNPDQPARHNPLDDVLRATPMGYRPTLGSRVAVLVRLLAQLQDRNPIHFFFTPNRTTSRVVWGLKRARPKRVVVQTATSSDAIDEHASVLSVLDHVVVCSEHARDRLRAAGFPGWRVTCIHPGVELPVHARSGSPRRRLLFAGDLDEVVVARLQAVASLLEDARFSDWRLTIACRPKGEEHAKHRANLRHTLEGLIEAGRVRLEGEVPSMSSLFAEADLQLFLADHVRHKVDLPLVLLEGMARGLPIAAVDRAPMNEVFAVARRRGETVGVALSPRRLEALARQLGELMGAPERIRDYGVAARRVAENEFSAQRMAERYLSLQRRMSGYVEHE